MARPSLARTSRSKRQRGSADAPTEIENHVFWVPPAGVLIARPDPRAIAVFERAMALLQRHDYNNAMAEFTALQQHFPAEGALLERARAYAALCQRELSRSRDWTPGTVEERLTAATAALNNGEDRRAELLASQVVDEAPRRELGHYLLAVVYARRGSTAAALEALRHAIAASPEVRAQARHDADFESLRSNDTFKRLMAETPAQSVTRRRS
jgi:tetratricopeptide (TPR) repeat protein